MGAAYGLVPGRGNGADYGIGVVFSHGRRIFFVAVR